MRPRVKTLWTPLDLIGSRTACLLLALTTIRCASTSNPRDFYPEEWKAEEAAQARAAPASPQKAAQSLQALALTHRTPNQCVDAARWELDNDPKRALDYLEACGDRPDFDVLQPLLRRPWLEFIRRSGARGYRVLLRAIAARSDYEADFGSVNVSGLPMGRLGLATAKPDRITPIIALDSLSGPTEVDEIGREEIKYQLTPGNWTETKYRVYANGRREQVSQRSFTVKQPTGDAPVNYVPTGLALRFVSPPRCDGPKANARIYLVKVGRRIQTKGEDKDVFAAELVACRGLGG